MEILTMIFAPYLIFLICVFLFGKCLGSIAGVFISSIFLIYYNQLLKRYFNKHPFEQEINYHSLVGEFAKKIEGNNNINKYIIVQTGEIRYGRGRDSGVVKRLYGELIYVD
jgi:hypothetical protein